VKKLKSAGFQTNALWIHDQVDAISAGGTMIDTLELKRCSFLADFSESELAMMASLAAPNQYREGETIYHAGSSPTFLYILRKGTVLLCYPNGKSLPLRDGGNAFGWSSLFSPYRHTATAVCLTDVDLFEVPTDELYRMIQMHANLGHHLMRKIEEIRNGRKLYLD
jgi:CRP-like cAMP-binding protein